MVPFTLAEKWQIFAKEWVEYLFNLIPLACIAIAEDLIFCNAIANAQSEQNISESIFLLLLVQGWCLLIWTCNTAQIEHIELILNFSWRIMHETTSGFLILNSIWSEELFCCVCVWLFRRVGLSLYWEIFTHLWLMRGWNR